MDAYSEIKFERAWKYCMVFIWGGDLNEMQAAWMAAASYATATEGVVFDEQVGNVLNSPEAIRAARDLRQIAPEAEAVLHNLMELVRAKR